MNAIDQLYAATASGLLVPRTALPPPKPVRLCEAPGLSRQQRRWLERRDPMKRCDCGVVISGNKQHCGACAKRVA
jgi:hypothetical protein